MCPPSILSMIILAIMLKEYFADPCSSYSLIFGQYQRSSNYTIQSTDIAFSDNFLSEGWYRFNSRAGNDIVTWAPSIYQCGTIYPVWMQGTLPTYNEGEVNRTACIVGLYGNCSKTLNIKVKNCGKYNVYHLVPVPQTSTGYCIGENTPCPPGQSSISSLTPCVDVVPVNTNPAVNASLENKKTNTTMFQTVEPVFKCLFDEPTGGPYWYDTYWYINTDTVKVVESQPFQSNQSWLYPKDWVDKYDLNMVVKCSTRVRHWKDSMPGHHNYSEDFKAGMFSTCEESITKNNTDIQSTTVHGQNVDQFSDGLNTPQSAPSEDSNIPLALTISLCIISVIILGVVCVLLYLKLKPNTQLSPVINYIKNQPPECGQPPIQHYETLKYDRNISPPPDYEFLSPPVADTFKAKPDSRPKTASSLVISFN